MTDAPTPPAPTPGAPADPSWVTVSVTVPAGRVADFYKQAAEWLAAEPPPFDDQGHTRPS